VDFGILAFNLQQFQDPVDSGTMIFNLQRFQPGGLMDQNLQPAVIKETGAWKCVIGIKNRIK
jgi:hypothetical protein